MMKIRLKRIFIITMAVLLCVISLSVTILAADLTGKDNIVIQVVHTNDIHGYSGHVTDKVVGFEKLVSYIKQQEADLVVDAGDLYHGQAFSTLELGGSIAELVKAIGYDTMTPGNHDWNYGKDRLKELGKLSEVTMLAGNVTLNNENFFGNDGTLTKNVDGLKIGVLGVYDPEIKATTAPRNIENLTFTDDAEKATELAQKLRENGCDIVIALSHQLYLEDFIGRTHGIDVLIAGHEHMILDANYPDADRKEVKVVEIGAHFENVGTLSITYDPNAKIIVSIDEQMLSAQEAEALPSDESVAKLLADINARQEKQLTQIVGTTGIELDGQWENLRVQQTGMGRLVTASYLKETGADIAFENAGGIRLEKVIPVGNITYQDIIDTSPFGNYVVTKQLTGKAVQSILEKSIDIGIQNKVSYDEWVKTGSDKVRWSDDNGSYLQFGGLTATYDPEKPMGERVLSVKVNGESLNSDKSYTIATNNYISLGKTFPELADVPEINQYGASEEVLVRFIQLGQDVVDEAATAAGVEPTETPDSTQSETFATKTSDSAKVETQQPETPDPTQTGTSIPSVIVVGLVSVVGVILVVSVISVGLYFQSKKKEK